MADVFEAAARLLAELNTPEPLDDADLRAVLDSRVEHLLEAATVERAIVAAQLATPPFTRALAGSAQRVPAQAMRAALLAAIGADAR